uniref:GPI ethanolamine phosphate transferase 2 C-terminal domain-containing protein n=1 Tax=Spongospora subterranea TaxID=70186 RepID=A0A0H5RB88_9EUKA|eukprot:CRZ05734.1 hypothetical protein [Spongospora subterranea]
MAKPHAGDSGLGAISCLIFTHAIGLYIFTMGFLLTRIELPRYSECRSPPADITSMKKFGSIHDSSGLYLEHLKKWEDSNSPELDGSTPNGSGCWSPRRFNKAILVIIDALRFDFVHADNLEPEHATNANYRNRFKLFQELSESDPAHARLFVFEADPPTTTMQRLKGIVTGGMPTFIDFSSNFDSSAITEDNFLHQFFLNGMQLVMMGDDTWINLFPTIFHRAYPFPSFNVKDLHTVDNGVIEHLRPEVDQGRFDLLIAHFLGIDHVGHRFYANHPTMKDKLQQLDNVLADLVESIDNETILFAFGDHGMTSEGNHGGTTPLETNSALFMFSKKPIFDVQGSSPPHQHLVIKQVDIVPTLSLLLGVPIPYSSLGMVISDLFWSDADLPWKHRCGVLRINAWQVQRYLHDYSEQSKVFESELMQHLTEEFLSVDSDYILYMVRRQNSTLDDDKHFMDLAARYQSVLIKSGRICREKWTTFNVLHMWLGMGLMLFGILTSALFLSFEPIMFNEYLTKCVLATGIVGSPIISYLVDLPFFLSLLFTMAFGALCYVCYVSIYHARRELQIPHPTICLSIALVTSYMMGSFSNSIIVVDALSVRFVSTSCALLLGLFDLRFMNIQGTKGIGICFLIAICLRSLGDGKSFGPGSLLTEDFFSASQLLQTYLSLSIMGIFLIWKTLYLPSRSARILLQSWALSVFLLISIYWWYDASVNLNSHTSWHSLPVAVYVLSALFGIAVLTLSSRIPRSLCIMFLISFVTSILLLLLGPRSPFVFVRILGIVFLLDLRRKHLPFHAHTAISESIFVWLISLRLFFATGHANTFSSLQFSAAFVGFEDFHYYRSAAMVGLNTFGGYLICALCLLLISPDLDTATSPRLHKLDSRYQGYAFERPALCITFLHAIRSCLSTINILVNRRHLMVWDIFAPKFVFDASTALIADAIIVAIMVIARKL